MAVNRESRAIATGHRALYNESECMAAAAGDAGMGRGWETKRRPPGKALPERPKSVSSVVEELKNNAPSPAGYRERSLKIHGLICGKCGREFNEKNRHLLTVHHRDGNHRNNPPDGSNWENLCAYCHEDEHSRDRLATYLSEGER